MVETRKQCRVTEGLVIWVVKNAQDEEDRSIAKKGWNSRTIKGGP